MIRPLVQSLITKEISEQLKVMGCASSTPMVATAGSEMLKAATHVAGDVKQKGEAVMEDATEAITSTLETAKETVSTAVAGITNDLGNAFKDGTQTLDEAKHKVLEGLHLETAEETGQTNEMAEMSSSRAPTPQIAQTDADSLKTSTPEPEIERALANQEESPPTPKPSLEELAQLSSQVETLVPADASSVVESTTVSGDATTTTTTTTTTSTTTNVTVERRKQRRHQADEEQRRPNTTDWEKFADQLAKSRKFKPYESFAHSQNQFSVYQDYTSMRDKPHHYDGHFSDGNSLSSASQSDLSSGHLTPAPTRRGQREFAKFVASEQPASVSRASSRLSNASNTRTFDFNPQRERISLPTTNRNRIGSGMKRPPTERISPWGRGKPAVVAEEPEYGRRLSVGIIPHTLHPVVSNRAIVESVTPLKDSKKEKHLTSGVTKKPATRKSQPIESTAVKEIEAIRVDLEPMQSEVQILRTPVRGESKFSKMFEKDMTGKHEELVRPSIEKRSEMEFSETPVRGESKFSKMFEKDISGKHKELIRPSIEEQSQMEYSRTPVRGESKFSKMFEKDISGKHKELVRPSIEEQSQMEFSKTPVRGESKFSKMFENDITGTQKQLNRLSMEELLILADDNQLTSNHATSMASTHKSNTKLPQRPIGNVEKRNEPVEAFITTLPSPTPSRISSNSSLDVIIQPISSLNTPSTKSMSPDQIVLTEYEDADLEVALAKLELLRGSTATLHSLSQQSYNDPRRHMSNTSSLLSSRRTSPWVMRKDYNASVKETATNTNGKGHNAGPMKAIGSTHKLLELCDICCNEFVMQ